MIPYIDLKATNAQYREQLREAFTRVLDSGWYIRGRECAAFESEFAMYCGTRECVGVGNGLDALTLVLRAWMEQRRIREGDEVIVPANTYIATILAITENRLQPVLVEPDELTYNIDPARVEAALTPRTRVILPVHLYGRAADMPAIVDIARRRGLLVLEDAAQAHGAAINGKRVGGWGDAAAFSFYPGKNLGALGDAGAVVSDDQDLTAAVRTLGDYGSRQKYVNEVPGVNSRLDEVQAAVLRVKLEHLDRENAHRRAIAGVYQNAIVNPDVTLPLFSEHAESCVWHVYAIRTTRRDQLRDNLIAAGISTLVHYPIPPHRQHALLPLLGELRLPITERIHDQVLSLPLSSVLSTEQAEYISRTISLS